MNDLTEKYLSRMLEGAEAGMAQVEEAMESMKTQLTKMEKQRDEMVTAIADLKSLLGLEDEGTKAPVFTLVPEEEGDLEE